MTRPPEPRRIEFRSVVNPDAPVMIHPQDDGSLLVDVDEAMHGRERTKAIMDVLGPYLRGDLTLTPLALLAAGWEAARRWAGRHQRASSAIAAAAVTVAVGMAALAATGWPAGDEDRPELSAARPPSVTLTAVRTATRGGTPPPPTPTAPRQVHETSRPDEGSRKTATRPAEQPETQARPPARTQQPPPAAKRSSSPTTPAARPSHSSPDAPRATHTTPPAKTADEKLPRMLPPTGAAAAEQGRDERDRPGTDSNEQATPPTVGQQNDQPPTPQPEPGPTALGGDDCDRLIHLGVARLLDVCLL